MEEIVALDPVWENGRLTVNADFELDADVFKTLEAVMAYMLRFRSFSETRWGKSCRSSRFILCALAVGLDGLVEHIEADDTVSMEKLSGFTRAVPLVRQYYAVNAFGCAPAESLVLEMLEDDRFARRAAELRSGMADEVEGIIDHPLYLWERLAKICDDSLPQDTLRESVLDALHTCLGYLYYDFWYQLEVYPLSLTQGNIEENLAALQLQDVDDSFDLFTLHVKMALELETPSKEVVIEALEFVRDELIGSTDLCERAHGSGAALVKGHEALSEPKLRALCVNHQCRSLFTPVDLDPLSTTLQSELEKLSKPRQAVSSYQAFQSQSLSSCSGGQQGSGKEIGQSRMTRTAQVWRDLPADVRARFEKEAAEKTRQRQERDSHEKDRLHQMLTLHRDHSMQSHKEDGQATQMRHCAFDDSDITELQQMVIAEVANSSHFVKSQDDMDSPRCPTLEEQAALLGIGRNINVPNYYCSPSWVRHICRHRDLFRGVAVSKTCNLNVAYFVTVSLQQPLVCAFLEIRRKQRILPAYESFTEDMQSDLGPNSRSNFEYLPIKHYMGKHVPLDPESDELVVFHDCYFFEKEVRTNSAPMDWLMFTRSQTSAPPATKPERSQPHIPKNIKQRLMQDFPWLRESDFQSTLRKPAFRGEHMDARCNDASEVGDNPDSSPDVQGEGGDVGEPPHHDEGMADQPDLGWEVDAELARIREEFGDDEPEHCFFTLGFWAGDGLHEISVWSLTLAVGMPGPDLPLSGVLHIPSPGQPVSTLIATAGKVQSSWPKSFATAAIIFLDCGWRVMQTLLFLLQLT